MISEPDVRTGQGHAWGAVSFVNAIPAGIGASAAVALSCRVRVDLRPTQDGDPTRVQVGGQDPNPLLRRIVEDTLRKIGEARPWDIRVVVDSHIPSGKGLKSSSAVSVALASALGSALDRYLNPEELARLSADAAISSGTSVTGAYDDALTVASGGVHVVDAHGRKELLSTEMPAGVVAVLWIPEVSHASVDELRARFHPFAERGNMAGEFAAHGELLRAMAINTEIVEEALSYDVKGLREAGQKAGALASGISGNGPALVFVAPKALAEAVVQGLPTAGAQVQTVAFVPKGGRFDE